MNEVGISAERAAELKKQILSLGTEPAYWRAQHDRARKREEALKKELSDKKARIRELEQRLYGRRSEGSKAQQHGWERKRQRRKRGGQPGSRGPGRRPHPDLEVREETYDLEEQQKVCPACGLPRKPLATADESELIEIEVKAYKRKIHRLKYAPSCHCPEAASLLSAEGPAKLIPHSRYGLSVWAHILLQKYRFQIPVARVLKALELQGLSMSPGTVGDGLKRLAPLFEPLYEALEKKSREASWWQADETRWSVFETTKSKSNHRWYLWIFLSEESVVHIIDPTRSAAVIEEHLGCVVEGILLVDRYSAYKAFAKRREGIKLAFCWSHLRRDFLEAAKAYPELQEWAREWEERCNQVFHRNRLRVQHAPATESFLAEEKLLGEALEEMHSQAEAELKQGRLHCRSRCVLKSLKEPWQGLLVFVEHPEIPMDNNGSERGLRNPVVGRKNYYGSGAIWSARFTAVMLSLFETLELYKINQQQWLLDYLGACAEEGGLKPPADIEPYLPWRIAAARREGRIYCGRLFSSEEIGAVKSLVEEDTSGSRTQISRQLCRLLAWRKADGALKERSMRMVLLKREADGHLVLPPRLREPSVGRKPIEHTLRTDPREDSFVPAGRLPQLELQIAQSREQQSLWNEYIDRYHYLGYSAPAGAYLKYFAYSAEEVVALLGFSSAAWRIAPRDHYIGWTDLQRHSRLHMLLNNSRFLILPWICSRNLASKLLSMAAARLPEDWQRRYGYRPVLLESFVEQDRFSGSSYRAANWILVGTTTGRGRNDRENLAALPKKQIFLYPLLPDFRDLLCLDSS